MFGGLLEPSGCVLVDVTHPGTLSLACTRFMGVQYITLIILAIWFNCRTVRIFYVNTEVAAWTFTVCHSNVATVSLLYKLSSIV